MRILHSYLFFSIKFAGGTSDLMFKILKIQSKTSDPVLLTGDYKFDANLFNQLNNVSIIKTRSFFDGLGLSIMPGLPLALWSNRHKFDYVHMHIYRTFQSAILFIYCTIFKIPYVIDAHGAVPYHSKKIKLKKLFDFILGRAMLRRARWLVAETDVGAAEYLQIEPNLDRKKIRILSPPFDTSEYLDLPAAGDFRKKFGIDSNKKLVAFLGRLHECKGNDFLIRAFASLLEKRTDIHLALIGPDDGHEQLLRALVEELDIYDHVTFTGFVGGREKNEALGETDIVVQLSRFEQGAWAPIEGVLCGKPIIVTSHTGAGEDVRRLNAGYLVDFDRNDQFCERCNYILDNYGEAKARTMRARDFIIQNLSMDARVGEYYGLFS